MDRMRADVTHSSRSTSMISMINSFQDKAPVPRILLAVGDPRTEVRRRLRSSSWRHAEQALPRPPRWCVCRHRGLSLPHRFRARGGFS
jgi:hypothetical protein